MARERKDIVPEDVKKDIVPEDVESEIKKMLEAARLEASDIIEKAKREAADIVRSDSKDNKEHIVHSKERGEELCEVMLFRDSGKYSDDVFVSVNGENCIIKRGEPVMIKRKFKAVLDNSMAQDYVSSDMQRSLSESFLKKTKELE